MHSFVGLSLATILSTSLSITSADAQFKENVDHYFDYYNAASRTRHAGKLDSAIYFTRLAIRSDPSSKQAYGYLGDLLIQRGNYAEGVNYLQKNILMGATPPEKFDYLFENYDFVKDRPEIIALQKRLPALVKEYYATAYNHVFASMIYTMLGRDQAIRGTIDKVYGEDSIKRKDGARVQAYLDTAINLPELLSYLKKNGFPAFAEMDNDITNDFQLIIHHLLAFYKNPAMAELNKLVQNAIYDGRYSSYAYMLALDWRAINNSGKQIYGTYIGPDPHGVLTFYPPIEDIQTVDARRAKWKQGPLKDVPVSDWRNPKLPVDYKP